jgi:hypothetical protein
MKILTIERDCGTHYISYSYGQVEGNDPDAEGFVTIEKGTLNIDTDEDGQPLDQDADDKLQELKTESDAIYEVDSLASCSNITRIK